MLVWLVTGPELDKTTGKPTYAVQGVAPLALRASMEHDPYPGCLVDRRIHRTTERQPFALKVKMDGIHEKTMPWVLPTMVRN